MSHCVRYAATWFSHELFQNSALRLFHFVNQAIASGANGGGFAEILATVLVNRRPVIAAYLDRRYNLSIPSWSMLNVKDESLAFSICTGSPLRMKWTGNPRMSSIE